MPDETPDQRVARKLGTMPDAIGQARHQWNQSPVGAMIRAVLADKLEQLTTERIAKLRRASPDDLKKLQGELDALELAAATVTARLE